MRSDGSDEKWWTLGVVCIAVFMLLLDVTVVNNALPRIQKDLGSSFSDLQWVVDAYALTLAAFLLTFGSLADLFGRRLVFVLGLGVFSAASLACGLSTTPLMLNLARAVQGTGAACMFACSAALIAGAFPPQERGSAFGIYGGTIGGAVAVGPLVGGAITQGIGWEWVFFINVPIGIAAILITLMRVAESRDPRSGHIDAAGFATFSASLCLLVFALVRGNAEGWGSPLIVSFLIGAGALLVAFVAVERRSTDPMFDLTLFRKPSFTGAAIVAFTLSASMFSMFLYLSLYLQNVLGLSPLEAGLRFLPLTLLSFFVAPIAGRLSGRVIPIRVLLGVGMLFVSAGLVLQGGLDADSEWTHFLPGFILAGFGIGLINPPLATTQVGVVSPQRSGMASGSGSTFRQVGIATGIAALGAIFQHAVPAKTIDALGSAPRGSDDLGAALASGNAGDVLRAVPSAQRQHFVDAFHAGFAGALNEILVIAAVVAFLGALAAFALVRRQDFVAAGGLAAGQPAGDRSAAEGFDIRVGVNLERRSAMTDNTETAILAGGCFWGVQELLRQRDGVISTRVGYAGGENENPTYRNHPGHAETVEIVFDPERISYRDILEFFFQIHDPTTKDRQGNDIGSSYRSEIFYTSDEQRQVAEDTIADVDASGIWPGKVVTKITQAGPFWEAEPEHQDYLQRYPNGYNCHFPRPNWKLPHRETAA